MRHVVSWTARQAWAGALAAALAALAGCGGGGGSGDGTAVPPPVTPGPSFFLDAQFTATQRATRAVVDAGTVWLVDANGDFVLGTDPAANWNATTGLTLSWKQIPGAVKYHVMGRNTVTAPTTWKELLVLTAPDARLSPTVVATGINPWSAGLGVDGHPWAFGNHVELGVSSEDVRGVFSDVSLAGPLDTGDGFPGLLTGVEIDRAGLPVPFDPQVERGAAFTKTIRLAFSEPMSTSAAPTLASQSANLVVRRVVASAWGTDPAAPSATPPSAATQAFLSVALAVKGACSELLVARSAGDLILEVRDTGFFTADAAGRLAFLDGVSGALLGEATGVAAVDTALGRLTLSHPLAPDLAVGALACALSGPGAVVAQVVSASGARLTVSDATPFFVGEPVAVLRPSQDGAAPLLESLVVAGVDTVAKALVLSAPSVAGQSAGALVIPLNGLGGEVALRPSAPLALLRDAAGGPDTELVVAGPTSLMVGDTVLVDADGRLATTPDQAQATVKAVKFAPLAGGACTLVLDLPASLTLLHGRSQVIGLGDSFLVGGTRDTSATAVTPLDPHADQFSPDGLRY